MDRERRRTHRLHVRRRPLRHPLSRCPGLPAIVAAPSGKRPRFGRAALSLFALLLLRRVSISGFTVAAHFTGPKLQVCRLQDLVHEQP